MLYKKISQVTVVYADLVLSRLFKKKKKKLLCRIFGFVARKTGSGMDNVCHLFAEHDPEQPASAIVNFISKVMIGSQKNA